MESEVIYRVIYGDTDCGGVMYYANYLRLFEIGRTELVRQKGLSYKEIEERWQIILPVVEVYAKYKASAKYDDLLLIKTSLQEIKPLKLTFSYQILKERQILVEGKTIHIPINPQGKIVRLPEEILKILKS
ncbi:MAG: acyl-CoA thioesterase [Caldimicrobium sp.]